jgi:hypothetical protein
MVNGLRNQLNQGLQIPIRSALFVVTAVAESLNDVGLNRREVNKEESQASCASTETIPGLCRCPRGL